MSYFWCFGAFFMLANFIQAFHRWVVVRIMIWGYSIYRAFSFYLFYISIKIIYYILLLIYYTLVYLILYLSISGNSKSIILNLSNYSHKLPELHIFVIESYIINGNK